MRLAIRFAIAALALRAAVAQGQPQVADILTKVGETYKAANEYEFVTDGAYNDGSTAPMHALIAFKPPNQYRMEAAIPGLSGDASAWSESVIVCNGFLIWLYLPKSNQYASFPLSALGPNIPSDFGGLGPEAIDEVAMGPIRRAVNFIKGAKLLREETIELAGAKLNCYVVSIPQKGEVSANTWWVDKQTYRVMRVDDDKSSNGFTVLKLNETLPDDLFTFTPPAGAHKLEMHR
jgi:outer membrane lipoprotein-sorting protein